MVSYLVAYGRRLN